MKRLIALLLAFAFIFSIILIVSCSNVETSVQTTNELVTTITEKETEVETEKEVVTTNETTVESTTTIEETTQIETTEKEDPIVVKNDSLLAWYTFDEIVDGYVEDKSGNGHNAKVNGNPKIVKLDDGTNAISLEDGGDHLYIKDNKAFNARVIDSFTLIATIKWSGKIYDTWPCIFNKGLLTSAGKEKYYGFWINTEGTPALGCTSVYGNGTSNTYANFKLDTNWHTFMAVQDGANDVIYFYIDNVVVGSRAACNCVTDIGVYIGINGNTNTQGQFIGQIKEIALYNSTYGYELSRPTGIDSMDKKTYEYTSTTLNQSMSLPYRIYFPTDYSKSDKEYPMLLFLHGYGEIGTNNTSQLRITTAQEENMIIRWMVERDDAIILVPQCHDPAIYNWVGLNHKWSTGAREKLPDNPTVALEAATSLLKEVIEEERVDKSRIYVSGISMGGYGTWEILARNPDLFAAAIPICGGGILSSAESLKDVAIWAFHGTADTTVPMTGTKDMIEALEKAGSTKAKATYFPGVGHSCWNNVFAVDGLIDWLYEQHK